MCVSLAGHAQRVLCMSAETLAMRGISPAEHMPTLSRESSNINVDIFLCKFVEKIFHKRSKKILIVAIKYNFFLATLVLEKYMYTKLYYGNCIPVKLVGIAWLN